MSVVMQPVNSSNIARAGYDPETQTLTIDFHSGRSYRYANVAEEVYRSLLDAPSAGKYFNQHIKDSYAEM